MAKCHWCDKTLPGDTVPGCGSCIGRTPPQSPEEPPQGSEGVSSNTDLTSLADSKEIRKSSRQNGKSAFQLYAELGEIAQKVPLRAAQVLPTMKLKSNSIRSRNFSMDSLSMTFDASGIAEFPAHQLPEVERLMVLRPGRFFIVEESTPTAAPASPSLEEARAAIAGLAVAEPKGEPKEAPPADEKVEAFQKPTDKKAKKPKKLHSNTWKK